MSALVVDQKDDLLLSLMVQKVEYNKTITYIKAYEEFGARKVAIPLAFSIEKNIPTLQPKFSLRRTLWPFEGDFNSAEQKCAFDDVLARLDARKTCILSVHVGFGKTFIALKLAAFIGLKTLIIIPTSKKVLQPQWCEEAARFIPSARVQLLQTRTEIDTSCDVFVIGSHTVSKIAGKLRFIPFIIVDELHLVLSSEGYKNLLHVQPKYLLGLSATPYRLDGSNKLIELFFGTYQVSKQLKRTYQVSVIMTPYNFKLEKTTEGTVNWGAVLNQQAEHADRNKLIADIICANRDLKFLVLCKRVKQIRELAQKCREGGISVQAVFEDIPPARDARTLIGSVQKLGVGFSDSSFGALILAADVQDYFIQYFGRVLRSPDACPTVYDVVDDCGLMKKHFKTRKEVYDKTGGRLGYTHVKEKK